MLLQWHLILIVLVDAELIEILNGCWWWFVEPLRCRSLEECRLSIRIKVIQDILRGGFWSHRHVRGVLFASGRLAPSEEGLALRLCTHIVVKSTRNHICRAD